MTIDATRQGRLSGLFGKNSHLCFQVFLQSQITTRSEERFYTLAKKYKIDVTEEGVWRLPETRYGLYILKNDNLRNINGKKRGVEKTAQPVYTLYPYSLDNYQKRIFGDNAQVLEQLSTIARQYTDSTRKEFPYLNIKRSTYMAKVDLKSDIDLVLNFKYFIQPYCPSLCHPNDLGKLKPITVIDGHVIEPAISRIDDIAQYRKAQGQALKP